jgi:hypothetical protein
MLPTLDEPLAASLVGHSVVRENLDRDIAPKPWVARSIHFAIPPETAEP